MKLLFDQNLSPWLPSVFILKAFMCARSIWEYAKTRDFVIVSKDSDFQSRSLLYGSPPKFIWLRVGNCPVKPIEELLRNHSVAIHTFVQDPTQSHLMLP
jgi:predicted nuclease of predicted toxin-antitoxin system